jgi:putative acetyltransferase
MSRSGAPARDVRACCDGAVRVREERDDDVEAVAAVHRAAFGGSEAADEPVEVPLYRALRASDAFVPELSLVATIDGHVVGHVICTRATLDGQIDVLGLGPVGVLPSLQGKGIGRAIIDRALAASDALGFPLVCLLGDPKLYERFGFEPARDRGIEAPDESWGIHFQVQTLSTYDAAMTGRFAYAAPFDDV